MRLASGMEWDGPDGVALEAALAKAGERFGILFSGTVGSGKTTAAKELAKGVFGFKVVDCSKPEEVDWLPSWRDWLSDGMSLVLDELGRDGIRNRFGNRSNPLAGFLRDLHAAWKNGDWCGRLFCTTNSSFDELLECYDESVMDRLREMCVPCRFSQNRRKEAGGAADPDAADDNAVRPVDAYRWDEYEGHGIDTESDEFRAAVHVSSAPGFLLDALRLLRVNAGTLTAEQCETVRAVLYGVDRPAGMRRYVRDAFVYAICAPRHELEDFCRGMTRYASAVLDRNPEARDRYNPANAAVFRDWWRRFDVAGAIGHWRKCHKDAPRGLDRAIMDECRRIQREWPAESAATA